MPCTYTGSLSGDRIMSLEGQLKHAHAELDRLTQMLYATYRHLERLHGADEANVFALIAGENSEGLGSTDIFNWWQDHKKEDAKRDTEKEAMDYHAKTLIEPKEDRDSVDFLLHNLIGGGSMMIVSEDDVFKLVAPVPAGDPEVLVEASTWAEFLILCSEYHDV